MRHALVFLAILGSGGLALAQERPGAGEILIDSTGPNAHHERRSVPLPPEGPAREAFMRDFVVIDVQSNAARVGTRTLSASEFYTRVDRPDLAAQAEEQTRKRLWLTVGGGVVAAAGVAAGLVVMGNAKNTNDPSCARDIFTQNACVDSSTSSTSAGALILGAGLVVGAGLVTWGLLTPDMVTTPTETVRLAADYNLALARKHGATGARLQLIPSLAPGQAGLLARVSF